jgi:uncharacterized HhH-GPD family protein
MPTLTLTGEDDADQLLSDNPFALLIGMLLDQQIPMEWAFMSPYRLRERLGGELAAAAIAAMETGELEAAFKDKPALHRFPGSMARRTQELCRHIVEHHDGDAASIWADVDDGAELRRRLRALPGYGEQKARIFIALLAKRFGVAPDGWEEAAGDYADDTPRSVADIDRPEALEAVREWKRSRKS